MNICKKKDESLSLTEKVQELELEIKTLKSNTLTTINNNNTVINNNTVNININVNFLEYMTEERIKDIFSKFYTIQTLLGSEESLAHFTIDNFLTGPNKPKYLCTDKERNKFCFIDENDKMINDSNAQILKSLIITHGFETIKNAYEQHKQNNSSEQLYTVFNNLKNLKINGKEYTNTLGTFLPKTIEERNIRDQIADIKEAIKVEENLEVKENEIEIIYENDDTIGEIEVRKLLQYKKHYKETGVLLRPKEFVMSNDNVREYLQFMKS